ncbi:hypothetical protein ACFFR1_27345, partial [Micromonospora sagamiensis]
MNTLNLSMLRKGVLGVAGVAFAAGVVAGPVAAATVESPAQAATPVAVAVQGDKPDTGRLMPHGVRGEQSRI